MTTLLRSTASPRDHSWMGRHNAAVIRPIDNEAPIVSILFAIDNYIGQAEDWNGVEEGEWRDYILGGQGIGQMIDAARTLLNGDLGRLDAGTCDAYLCDLAERIGYDLDVMEMSGL
jgi:hypothetical protein